MNTDNSADNSADTPYKSDNPYKDDEKDLDAAKQMDIISKTIFAPMYPLLAEQIKEKYQITTGK